MSEIKYEAVFGDQELLSEAGIFTGLDVVTRNVDTDLYSYCRREDLTYNYLIKNPVVAMRRIIRTPTWTVADQKAGKLPEVGAELAHKTQGLCEFIGRGVDDKTCWALKLKSSLIYIADKNWCSPIESPEEKAARLEDEWVDAAYSNTLVFACVAKDENDRLKEHLRAIYKAQISGDLPVPVKGE